MFGVGKEFGCRADFNHLAVLHDRHIITDLCCHPQIMGDKQHGEIHLLADFIEQLKDLRLY